eukprot:2279206-Pyramimonas_sp.AAC.1
MRRAAAMRCTTRRKVWEVCAGEARLSQSLRDLGADVETFGPHAGWDFAKAEHQERFKRKLHE